MCLSSQSRQSQSAATGNSAVRANILECCPFISTIDTLSYAST